MQKLNNDLQLAKRNMELARDRQTHYANVHRRDFVFKEGEEVLLSTQNLKLPKGITPKLSNRYTGPFKIVDVVTPTAYKLQLPNTWKIHPVFHVSLLKAYNSGGNNDHEQKVIEIVDDNQREYEVDKLLGKRFGKDSQMEYLVLWKGYPELEATWETYESVKDLKALDEFEQITQTQTPSSSRDQNIVNHIWRKWTKSQVQKYIMSLILPDTLGVTSPELVNIMKRHQVNGGKLTELTADTLIEMGLSAAASEWMMEQLELLFRDKAAYKGLYASS
jgi:hypothetical protein